jgi:small subunit ribosomal protein S13
MNFHKYGIGATTDINFRKNYGINIRNRNFFLKNTLKTVFKRININTPTEKALFNKTKKNISFYKDTKSYRGLRHRKGYPVRGQRTHTNATAKAFKRKTFI